MGKRLRILALEPYYGGSHRAFLDALCKYSRHEFVLLTLPARHWKWRMRGSALWFSERLRSHPVGEVDVLLCSDMMSVADFRSLSDVADQVGRSRVPPIACYFHENQLTYPIPDWTTLDFQYGFTNLTSCLTAHALWFNSRAHLDAFAAAVDVLLRKMPDFVPPGLVAQVLEKAEVMYPGVDFEFLPDESDQGHRTGPLRILWNHRWEYDKNPEEFFRAVLELDRRGLDFRLVVVGETFRQAPAVFEECRRRLAHRLEQVGYVPDRTDYGRILAGCDLVVSTAIQENFGIAVVEAMAAGCKPLFPRRLSYPELIPESLHDACLYDGPKDLVARLSSAAPRSRSDPAWTESGAELLRDMVRQRFSARVRTGEFDAAFEELAGSGR